MLYACVYIYIYIHIHTIWCICIRHQQQVLWILRAFFAILASSQDALEGSLGGDVLGLGFRGLGFRVCGSGFSV